MYTIGQLFEGGYPPEAAQWCNNNGAMLVPVDNGFEIQLVPVQSQSDKIKAEIAALESQQTLRRLREAMLTDAGRAWLEGIDAQIATLRSQLK